MSFNVFLFVFLFARVCVSFGGESFEKLMLSVMQNDDVKVSDFDCKDIVKCNRYGYNSLHLAYNNKKFDLVISLLKSISREERVNFLSCVRAGVLYRYFLIHAVKYADAEVVRLALPESLYYHENEIYVAAVERNDVEIFHEVLSVGGEYGDKCKKIMLNAAAAKGFNDIINELVMAGVKIEDYIRKKEKSCLYLALKNNHFETVEMMWKFMKPKKKIKSVKMLMNMAARENNVPALLWLLSKGGDPNGVYDVFSPLQNGLLNLEILEVLLEHGAEVNKCVGYGSALWVAAASDQVKAMELLIRSGAVIDLEGKYETTPLIAASGRGYVDCVKLLINSGANINHVGYFGPALAMAALNDELEVMKLLLASGADINIVGGEGTALCKAIQGKKTQAAEYLIKNGADVNLAKDESPLELAEKYHMHSIVKLLKEYGAK